MRKIGYEEATEKWGKELRDGDETYKSLGESDEIFAWDWKRIPSDDFLSRLDAKLKPHGLQVVEVKANSDTLFWTIEKV